MTTGTDLFSVLIDTREQSPWKFPENVSTVIGKLASGDYSIEGYDNCIVIERKSLADLVNTVIHGRTRFQKELRRLETVAFRCVAIEANIDDIFNQRYNSDASPQSIIGSVLSFERYHCIPFYWWGDRQIAAYMAFNWLKHAWRAVVK